MKAGTWKETVCEGPIFLGLVSLCGQNSADTRLLPKKKPKKNKKGTIQFFYFKSSIFSSVGRVRVLYNWCFKKWGNFFWFRSWNVLHEMSRKYEKWPAYRWGNLEANVVAEQICEHRLYCITVTWKQPLRSEPQLAAPFLCHLARVGLTLSLPAAWKRLSRSKFGEFYRQENPSRMCAYLKIFAFPLAKGSRDSATYKWPWHTGTTLAESEFLKIFYILEH